MEPKLSVYIPVNTDCKKVRLEAARMNKNSVLDPELNKAITLSNLF